MTKSMKTKPAPAKPVITPAAKPTAKATRVRDAVLFATTPNKLAAQVGGDTTVLVSRKHLRQLLQKSTADNLLDQVKA